MVIKNSLEVSLSDSSDDGTLFLNLAPVGAELCGLSSKGQERRKEEGWDVALLVGGLLSVQEAVGLISITA